MKKEAVKVLASVFGGGNSVRDVKPQIRNTIRRMQPPTVAATTTPAFNRRETEMLLRNVCPMRSRG